MSDYLTLEPQGGTPNPAPEGEIRVWLGSDGNLYKRVGSAASALLVEGGTEADPLSLKKTNNLSDLANAGTARTNLGLGNVTNTSDANKPVSTAQQTALDLKAALATAMGFINHGAVAGTVRPVGYASVTWLGSVEPDNMTNDDFWVQP